MPKAVLVMPEMPGRCADCKICHNEPDYGIMFCPLLGESVEYAKRKPVKCPLKEMPERDSGRYAEPASHFYQSGWNDAIEAIEGSGEDGA